MQQIRRLAWIAWRDGCCLLFRCNFQNGENSNQSNKKEWITGGRWGRLPHKSCVRSVLCFRIWVWRSDLGSWSNVSMAVSYLGPILWLFNLQLQRQRCSRLEHF
jgi:hypothetical protein